MKMMGLHQSILHQVFCTIQISRMCLKGQICGLYLEVMGKDNYRGFKVYVLKTPNK